jgi:hypothetical protein
LSEINNLRKLHFSLQKGIFTIFMKVVCCDEKYLISLPNLLKIVKDTFSFYVVY